MSSREMVLGYVREFIDANGYPPTVRQIGAAVGLSSTATVQMHLDTLRQSGLLEGEGRTLRLVKVA